MFIAIGGPQAHVTLSMTDTLFQQPASTWLFVVRPKFLVRGDLPLPLALKNRRV